MRQINVRDGFFNPLAVFFAARWKADHLCVAGTRPNKHQNLNIKNIGKTIYFFFESS
jgi:hypothetical protein